MIGDQASSTTIGRDDEREPCRPQRVRPDRESGVGWDAIPILRDGHWVLGGMECDGF